MSLKRFRRGMTVAACTMVFAVCSSCLLVSAADTVDDTKLHGGAAAVMDRTDDLGYSTELYDGTNGLPTSDANAIVATKDGFIWIGGYSGVLRYDGTSFEQALDNAAITNANTLFEDSVGRLWIGTNDNGIVAVRQKENWHYDYTDGLVSSSVRAIAEDPSGQIIVGTALGLYYVDTAMRIHRLDEPMLNTEYIERLVRAEDGVIYGFTNSGLIFSIEDRKVGACINSADLNIGYVTTIFPDPQNPKQLYLGTSESAIIYGSFDDQFKNHKKISVKETLVSFVYDANSNYSESVTKTDTSRPVSWIDYAHGRIWVVRDDVVGWLDSANGFHPISNLPMNGSICAMEEDYEGNLWFASTRQGVMKIVANKFTDITEQNGLESAVVNATCLHDNKLFIGTDEGLQIIGKDHQIVTDKILQTVGDTRVRCLYEDKDNNLWIATFTDDKGLICYTPSGEIKSYTRKNGMPDNQVRSITESSEGSLLVTTNGGLVILKDGEIIKTYGTTNGISNPVVLSAIEHDGIFYLGTDGDGLYEIQDGAVVHKGREDSLTSDVILRIKYDEKRDVIWMITSNSIQYIKDGEIKKVNGFPYTNNYDMYFDNAENAWILSSNGIYVVKAQDLIDRTSYEYQHYDYSSGMPCMATVNAYSAQDDDGVLFVAGRTGVFTVNIDHYFEMENRIRLCVPYIETDEERYYPDEEGEFHLPASAGAMTIYPYAITFSMQNPKIQYILEGVDKEDNQVYKKNMKTVRYTNLHGGDFPFRLSVMNSSTGEVQQTEEFVIHIDKAFYENIWFILLVIIGALLIVTLIVVLIVRRYIERRTRTFLEKQERDELLVREMVEAFSKTIDMKDKYTKGHSSRVARYTTMLAEEMGYDEEEVKKFHNIALLHDIGKIGVPAEILNKQGKLSDEEFAIIKSHSTLGYDALKNISLMPDLAIGAGAHHERPDGKGYPKGLKGDEIPPVAKIIAVADTFDAMYSNRPYRKRMNFEKAVSIIREVSGTQLSEDVVDAFLRLVEKGEFRAADDTGGGSMEDINNIRKHFDDNEQKGGNKDED